MNVALLTLQLRILELVLEVSRSLSEFVYRRAVDLLSAAGHVEVGTPGREILLSDVYRILDKTDGWDR